MKSLYLVIMVVSFGFIFAHEAVDETLFIKPRASVKRDRPHDVKVKIITSCENLLTSSSSLIASKADLINDIVATIKDVCSDDSEFSTLSVAQLHDFWNQLLEIENILKEQEAALKRIRTVIKREKKK